MYLCTCAIIVIILVFFIAEFSRLCQQWGAVDWSWMAAFKIDMALYKGDHDLYRKLLQAERQKIKREEISKVSGWRYPRYHSLILITIHLIVVLD